MIQYPPFQGFKKQFLCRFWQKNAMSFIFVKFQRIRLYSQFFRVDIVQNYLTIYSWVNNKIIIQGNSPKKFQSIKSNFISFPI